MKRSRFTEEQIIGVLREQEAGIKVAEVCRQHGISEPTFYAWKAKFGGMSVSDAKRLKQLEGENEGVVFGALFIEFVPNYADQLSDFSGRAPRRCPARSTACC